jgi:hypothetical protein
VRLIVRRMTEKIEERGGDFRRGANRHYGLARFDGTGKSCSFRRGEVHFAKAGVGLAVRPTPAFARHYIIIDAENGAIVAERSAGVAQDSGDFREPSGLPQAPQGLIEMFGLRSFRGAHAGRNVPFGFCLKQLLEFREQVPQRRRGRVGRHPASILTAGDKAGAGLP